ncbi:MAG: CcoQ/FixQ family Cbb3-type cytochrome c oxidase assembly chaperone [Chitinophagaceae bacterium]|nr:CcoQ/FixQ family Cbb3-type cytochrome c oxidase assembly chaperone [Chitinophagaceae bacterium]MBL0055941.1 CcoQ/FixQ family Cbb3-type cytochrome c oxidase assembly chaperone [Chitinophagaceae bacterium]
MFKFIQQYAESIDRINIYPMISLLIFFLFFVVLIIWVKKMDKENITRLSELPFEQEELTKNNP